MDNENLADNVATENSETTSPVVTEQATEEISLENTATEEAESEPKATEEAAKEPPKTDKKAVDAFTKAFAERLNEARANDKAKISELETELKKRDVSRLTTVAKKLGFEGETIDDILDAMESDGTGKTVEEIKAKREAERKRIEEAIENNPDVIEAKRIKAEAEQREIEKSFNEFVSTEREMLSKIDPSLKDADIPTEYFGLRAQGVTAEVAHQTVFGRKQSTKQKTEKQPDKPVKIGSTETTGTVEKDYYTADDVMNMSAEEIRRNFDKIEKSRKSGRWNT